MSSECYPPELLAQIRELPEDSPRRIHLADCPRCRARMAAFEEFVTGGGEREPARLDEAMTHLEQVLDGEIFGEDGATASSPEIKIRQRYLDSRFTRGMMALAAVILLFVALQGLLDRPAQQEIRLRSQNRTEVNDKVILGQVVTETDGALLLSWQIYPTADSYQVKIIGADLRQLASFTVSDSTSLRLESQTLADLGLGSEPMAWRVIALNIGDEIARSRPSTLIAHPRR